MSHKLISALSLTGALLLSLPAVAQGRGQGPQRGQAGMGMRLSPGFWCLNLSDAQKTQLQAIQKAHEASITAKREAVQAAQAKVREAMPNSAVTEAELKTLIMAADAARLNVRLEKRNLLQESLGILTPEQKAQWEKNRANAEGTACGMGGGRGRHGRRGFGGM